MSATRVARAGYYHWLNHPVTDRAQEDARLLRLIRFSFTASHDVYGAPRVLLGPRELGETCSKHRVERLMRENGLRAIHVSRKIVGWAAKPRIHRELIIEALTNAVRRRRPRRTVIHSDQGTQYGSDAWLRFCRANHLEPSMSQRGNCWDNAVAESLFGSLKKERIKEHIYSNREAAISDISEYIDGFYNPRRRHSHLSGVSPDEFESAHRGRRSGVH